MRPGPGRKTGQGCVAGKQIPRPNRFLSRDSLGVKLNLIPFSGTAEIVIRAIESKAVAS